MAPASSSSSSSSSLLSRCMPPNKRERAIYCYHAEEGRRGRGRVVYSEFKQKKRSKLKKRRRD